MLELSLSLPLLPIAQAKEPWLTTWLTPIWYLGTGIAIGLVALFICVALFRLLAITPWSKLSDGPVGHVVALGISIAMTFGLWALLPEEARGRMELQEPLLLRVALFLCCSIVGWSLVFGASKQAAKNALATLTEGAAGYLMIAVLTVVFISGAVWGIGLLAPRPIVADPQAAFQSIPKLFETGKQTVTRTIPGKPDEGESPFVPVELEIDFEQLKQIEVVSTTTVMLGDEADTSKFNRVPILLAADEAVGWRDTQTMDQLPVPYDEGTQLHIQNREIYDAEVTFTIITQPPVPEAASLLITALVTLLIGLLILLQQAVAPRASAVAHATVKNELAQPLFLVLMLLGAVAILVFEFLSFNTFGEDIKLLKDCGITFIMLLATFQGIWSASSSISEEIEGKTALTVLSKPIQRRSFIIGKFMGIFWVLMLMFVILGSLELLAVSYKPIYDAREASGDAPTWQLCHHELVQTIPGLAMAFMQSVVLTAISVALATRLPQLANLAICFALYILGNLTTALVSSSQEGFEIVQFVANLVATIIPILEHFSLQAAIDADNPITVSLLCGNLIYCLLYVLLAMFLALLLFEDRDLA